MMASARYSHLAKDNPARDIRPSFVMYTCHLSVILSLCFNIKNAKQYIMKMHFANNEKEFRTGFTVTISFGRIC